MIELDRSRIPRPQTQEMRFAATAAVLLDRGDGAAIVAFMPYRLPRVARNVLLHGRYAHLGGRSLEQRGQKLSEIAAAYSLGELLKEPGIGLTRAREIEAWLNLQGLGLRTSDPSAMAASAPANVGS
ncbi:hypothetical protein QO058_30515 (plasmid) [Bosea vestrisii]|uniref:hypothetical protein n=1 Tax=Bosea vestrisii TaxID=151416 RepID=UPI0024DFDF0F|nr:hypothetical protein [Bosea vestrisii]WID99728.1 hypothetical protein QO058_30515 [Bosea vestrisii]